MLFWVINNPKHQTPCSSSFVIVKICSLHLICIIISGRLIQFWTIGPVRHFVALHHFAFYENLKYKRTFVDVFKEIFKQQHLLIIA